MDLVVWKEKGLSSAEEAEARYQRIRANTDPMPFSELDEQMQAFIRDAAGKFQEAIVGASAEINPVDRSFSRHGVLLRFGEEMNMTAYPMTSEITTTLDLTLYDPEMGLVEGYDDSMDIEVYDNE